MHSAVIHPRTEAHESEILQARMREFFGSHDFGFEHVGQFPGDVGRVPMMN